MNTKLRDNLFGYGFISPFIIGLLAFTVIPMFASLYFSFTNFDLFTKPQWVGLDNYIKMFTEDSNFWQSMKVTLIYSFFSIPLRLIFALGIAMLLNVATKASGFYRALFYLPSIIGGSVAIGIMWRNIFGNEGAINSILNLLGINPILWYQDPMKALWTLIFLAVWQFGSSMLIFLSGLKNIPTEYYEAAYVDGAGKIKVFFKVTLPLLTPIIFFNLVMQTIMIFMTFTPAYIISKGQGSPMGGTLLFSLYIYQQAFDFFQMGYASALAWIILLLVGIITGLLFISSKYWVHYES